MKKKLLLFVAILALATNLSAQETGIEADYLNAFTAEKAEWTIDYTGELGSPKDIGKVILEGDTVVDEMNWKIVKEVPRVGTGFVRVDEQKILFKPSEEAMGWVYPYNGEAIVVYDFSSEVGDSFLTYNDREPWFEKIIRVDSITLNDGKKHKRFTFSSGSHERSFVEGLGSIDESPFFMLMALVTGNNQNDLVCCHVNGQLLYKNPRYADCDGTPVGNEVIKTPDNLNISMNNNILQVTFDEETPFDVDIYSLNGVLLKQRKGNSKKAIIPTHFSKGICIVRITCGKDIYTQKIYNK